MTTRESIETALATLEDHQIDQIAPAIEALIQQERAAAVVEEYKEILPLLKEIRFAYSVAQNKDLYNKIVERFLKLEQAFTAEGKEKG